MNRGAVGRRKTRHGALLWRERCGRPESGPPRERPLDPCLGNQAHAQLGTPHVPVQQTDEIGHRRLRRDQDLTRQPTAAAHAVWSISHPRRVGQQLDLDRAGRRNEIARHSTMTGKGDQAAARPLLADRHSGSEKRHATAPRDRSHITERRPAHPQSPGKPRQPPDRRNLRPVALGWAGSGRVCRLSRECVRLNERHCFRFRQRRTGRHAFRCQDPPEFFCDRWRCRVRYYIPFYRASHAADVCSPASLRDRVRDLRGARAPGSPTLRLAFEGAQAGFRTHWLATLVNVELGMTCRRRSGVENVHMTSRCRAPVLGNSFVWLCTVAAVG